MFFQNSTVDNTKDVKYTNRIIDSGPLNSLIDRLIPITTEEVDEVLFNINNYSNTF